MHEDNVDLLARLGVVGGYPDGTFRPGSALLRGHMAALLARHLDVLADLDLDHLGPIRTQSRP
ncbi:MAG: S-layer homology domain-containing protein [Actinobacteria bacterium]|nr:S-layer homology domain-containing protein [Actinomycetota bacterium]